MATARSLTEVGHDVPELSRGDETIAVLVEHLECLLDLLFAVRVLHLPGHHGQEFGEVDRAIAISIDFVNLSKFGQGLALVRDSKRPVPYPEALPRSGSGLASA